MEKCYKHYEDMETKRKQIIYLREVKGLTPSKIADYVDYAVSTIRTYMKKFVYLLEEAIAFFESKVKKIIQDTKEYAYIIQYVSDDIYLKIGKSNNVDRRMKELTKQYGAHHMELVEEYEFDDEESALTMENVLRKYFKNKYPTQFVPRDRFKNILCKEEDLDNFTTKYNFILENF